jgi:hypothetical protein
MDIMMYLSVAATADTAEAYSLVAADIMAAARDIADRVVVVHGLVALAAAASVVGIANS